MKTVLGIAAIIVLFLPAGLAHAYDISSQQSVSTSLPTILPTMPKIDISGLSSPISEFINSAKQIIERLNIRGTKISTESISPRSIFEGASNWIKDHTGLDLVAIIKAVGKIIVWILSLIIKIIQWGLSLI